MLGPGGAARALAGATALTMLIVAAAPAHARPDDPWPYQWPVVAPISDPFRPPEHRYGAGNRGLEFTTAPGAAVVAAREGIVVFAGQVGGSLHVTVRHPDGVRTSYSFLAGVSVVRGKRVRAGQQVGVAGAVLHVGARLGVAYVDPAILFGGRRRVHLVPVAGR